MNNSSNRNRWQGHPGIRDVDKYGFATTKDGGRIAPDVKPENISPQAVIRGNSLLQGSLTCVQANAVVENSYCKDAVIQEKAVVLDSVLVSTDHKRRHKCDAASKYVVQGCDVNIAPGAHVESCHITNSSVGPDSYVKNSTILDSCLGANNSINLASVTLVHSESAVRIDGPTEVSEAWLGRKTHIHRKGYLEGVFSNEFYILGFDEDTGKLRVKEILDIPHVSEYGAGTINSTNSGRLFPQPDGIMKNFGPQVELWYDPLLSHEPICLGPCCWVCPWTKVVGGSAQPYSSAEDTLEDRLHTYLMPFSVSGYGGESTLGLVLPGELSNGYGHKLRRGCWAFTYAPDAVIQMVGRLYEALEDDEKDKADIVAAASLENALCILKYRARELGFDLDNPRDDQRGSQAKWFWDCRELIKAHISAGIWKFKQGKPIGWVHSDNKWRHEKLDNIRQEFSPDEKALDLTENDLLTDTEEHDTCHDEMTSALAAAELPETTCERGRIDAAAKIHPSAIIDHSAKIDARVTIRENAFIGPGTVLKGNTTVGANARLFRTVLDNASIGDNTSLLRCLLKGTAQPCKIGNNVTLTGCKVIDSTIGDRCTGVDAAVINSTLAADSRLSMFARLDNVQAISPTIIGGAMKDCRIDTVLMSMHSASCATGLIAQPVTVEVEGKQVRIEAIPMLGGGCQIRGNGTGRDAVTIEGAFIGSNAIVESGCFIGLGAFVLGRLGPNEGLLPFTVSHQQGPQADEIGACLTRFANILVTHIIGWTYQALPKEQAGNIVHLINGSIREGINAVTSELNRRRHHLPWDENAPCAKYKSMQFYTEQQLQDGLRIYEEAIEQGNWDMVFDGANLSFANAKGTWLEKNGYIRWQKNSPGGI